MTAVQNLSCSQSSLFWESFQNLCPDEEIFGRIEAQHRPTSQESGSLLLASYSSISRVLGIIESAEDLMFSSDRLLNDEDLEPIPIGPNGIQTIISPDSTATEREHKSAMVDCCHPAILMPTFLDIKNQSISTDAESLLDSFIHTMKRDADFCGDATNCPEQQLSLPRKKQRTMETVSADTTVSSASTSASDLEQDTEQDTNDDMNEGVEPARFRRYQADQWMERFEDLVNFKAENGHCLVPHSFPPNQQLAQWVKRQRYQHKLKMLGRHSTLTDERLEELQQMGFVWDSHKAAWEERLESLKKYCAEFGNCLVPTNYEEDRSLAVWVKCQRRQMKLFRSGRRSTMTQDRFEALDRLGFEWNPRNL